jgi:hypothetical protein
MAFGGWTSSAAQNFHHARLRGFFVFVTGWISIVRLCGDDFAGCVLPVMATQPADVPFLGVPIAVAVEVHAHFDAVNVQAAPAGFEFHGAAPSNRFGAGSGLRLGSSNNRGWRHASSIRLQAMSK